MTKPIPRPEVLQWIQDIKGKRLVYSSSLPKVEKKHCIWCGKRLTGAQRTWCVDGQCFKAFDEYSGINVYNTGEAHNWICDDCGVNVRELKEELTRMDEDRKRIGYYKIEHHKIWWDFKASLGIHGGRYHCYDVHHIVALKDGGGNEMGNRAFLCYQCHKRRHSKKG